MFAFPYGIGHLGQRLFPVDLTVGPIQVPVQLAPFFFRKPSLVSLEMPSALVALAVRRLLRCLFHLTCALFLHPRGKARAQIAGGRERRRKQRDSNSCQKEPLHQPHSVFRAAPCLGATYCIIDVPAAGPAGKLLPRLTHPNHILIT